MKSIKKITALTLAVIMLLSAVLSTSAYVFEEEDYTEYFTGLPSQCSQSHINVSLHECGGYGIDNDFQAMTVYSNTLPNGVYYASVYVYANLSTNNIGEVYITNDLQDCDRFSAGISAVVDGSDIAADYTILTFSVQHRIDLYKYNKVTGEYPETAMVIKTINGSTSS